MMQLLVEVNYVLRYIHIPMNFPLILDPSILVQIHFQDRLDATLIIMIDSTDMYSYLSQILRMR